MKAAPRALLLPGPMNHACIQDADVMRLKGAGCLTCESVASARRSCRTGLSGEAISRVLMTHAATQYLSRRGGL